MHLLSFLACGCSTLAYKTLCDGQYVSMLVDYLVEPYA